MRNEKDRLPEHPSFPGNFPASVPRQWPRRMLMTPQMVAIGGLLAFLTVVLSMVVLPTTTYKPAYSENWLPLSESARNGVVRVVVVACSSMSQLDARNLFLPALST